MPKEGRESDDEEGGARYGRISCSDPGMQQQPARDEEIAPVWRGIYKPDGELWACLDYSQQEPRWLVHFAALTGCVGAAEMRRRYIEDPKLDNHKAMAELTGLARDRAKPVYLGLCYGMGPAKLCRKLDLPTKWVFSRRRNKMVEVAGDEGEVILGKFHGGAPFVRQFSEKAQAAAESRGYVRTVSGRKCRFPRKRDDSGYDFTHKAGNRVIQGSSGDQTKTAMVNADEAGFRLQLQVHDELDLTLSSEAEAEPLAEIMRTSVPSTVPFRVDVDVGRDWGECT